MAKKAFVYDGTQWVDLSSSVTDLTNYAHLPSTQFGFRNEIINGNFQINQRAYVSASNLASGAYGFDRWKSTFTNTTLTFTSAPQGQIVTINSGGSIEQVIERANLVAGTYVLSWTGTATARVYNTGATPPDYAASPVLVTLDGLANVEVEFTASGGTRTVGTVQLEPGSIPTRFEQRPIGTELALCQRYYWRRTAEGAALAGAAFGSGVCTTGTTSFIEFYFPVQMRVIPTMAISSGNLVMTDSVTYNLGSVSIAAQIYNTTTTGRISFNHAGTGTTFRPHVLAANVTTSAAWVDASAEL